MTIKFDVPFPEKPTDKQIADIEDDINSRIQTLNQKTGATYELEYYMVNVRVALREVATKAGKINKEVKVKEKVQKDDRSLEGWCDIILGKKGGKK